MIVAVPSNGVKSLPVVAVLEPATNENGTIVSVVATALCVIVSVPLTGPASVPFVPRAMLNVAVSSSVMSMESVDGDPTEMLASPGPTLPRVIVTVSVCSTMASFRTATSIVADVIPAGITTDVPGDAKSLPDVAVPPIVKFTVVSVELAVLCVTVN